MFRLGGSTSGITSGLDTPKRGRVDGPGGYAGIDYDKAYETSERIADKYYPRRGANINRFLIDWGLNMVGNPPSGNVLQTAAKQAQQPTRELFESMDRSGAMRAATGADIFGKVISAEGEMMGEGKMYKDQVMLDALLSATKDKIRITKQLQTEEDKIAIENLENELTIAETTINQIRKRDPLVDKFLGSTKVIEELLAVILPAYDKALIEDPNNPGSQILKYPKGNKDAQAKKIQDAMAEIMQIIQSGAAGTYAEGGRAGYQGGELVEDINVEETIQPEGMPGQQPIQPGGAPEVDAVGMSFEELRERLPATITDDIVILLSQSAQALEDFATIQTQQDVDNFNTKYNVNLILPSEG
jgi:hypothetical protein